MQDTYTDDGQLQPIQVMDTTWLDAAVDRFSSQTAKRVLEMKTAGEEGYRSLDHYRKRGSVNAYRAAALLCYLYQVENRMAAAGIAGAVSRTDDQIHRLCIKVYRFLASHHRLHPCPAHSPHQAERPRHRSPLLHQPMESQRLDYQAQEERVSEASVV